MFCNSKIILLSAGRSRIAYGLSLDKNSGDAFAVGDWTNSQYDNLTYFYETVLEKYLIENRL